MRIQLTPLIDYSPATLCSNYRFAGSRDGDVWNRPFEGSIVHQGLPRPQAGFLHICGCARCRLKPVVLLRMAVCWVERAVIRCPASIWRAWRLSKQQIRVSQHCPPWHWRAALYLLIEQSKLSPWTQLIVPKEIEKSITFRFPKYVYRLKAWLDLNKFHFFSLVK